MTKQMIWKRSHIADSYAAWNWYAHVCFYIETLSQAYFSSPPAWIERTKPEQESLTATGYFKFCCITLLLTSRHLSVLWHFPLWFTCEGCGPTVCKLWPVLDHTKSKVFTRRNNNWKSIRNCQLYTCNSTKCILLRIYTCHYMCIQLFTTNIKMISSSTSPLKPIFFITNTHFNHNY